MTFGPTAAAGTITFTLQSQYGRGSYRVEGVHPSYTVRFDDAFGDGDFDDVVLWVRCTSSCDLLARPSGDPILDHPVVQSGLKDIWEMSDPQNPTMFAREERGMWIVRNVNDGTLSWVPFDNGATNRCRLEVPVDQFTRLNDAANTDVIALAHTHPHDAGTYQNPGNCGSVTSPDITINDGPSGADKNAAKVLGIPSYVLDKRHVHRALPNGQIRRFHRDPNCN